LDKKKLGEGSYGSVCKATNISTKVLLLAIIFHLELGVGWGRWFFGFPMVLFWGAVVSDGFRLVEGHSGGEDHLEVSDEEFGALQAGNCAFLRPGPGGGGMEGGTLHEKPHRGFTN